MNDDVDHKWLLLDKDVASVLMSKDSEYWKGFLRRDGKILVKLWTRSFTGVLRNAEVISILKISKSWRMAIEMMIK